VTEPKTCIEAEPFALQVADDSMEPEFAKGCIIIVDPTGHVRDGAFVVAEVEGQWHFRKLCIRCDELRLEALHPGYESIGIGKGTDAIKGVVVQRAGIRRSYHKRYE